VNSSVASTNPQFISEVVGQHVEEAAILCNMRSAVVTAPHVKLHHLRRLDDRLLAHLDGIAVAGDSGGRFCEAALERPGSGEVFTAAVRAIEDDNLPRQDRLFALAEALPEAQAGLISAFGWVSGRHLEGRIKDLLSSGRAFRQQVGIAACVMHHVAGGSALEIAIGDSDSRLRARGLRAAGEGARRDLVSACTKGLTDHDAACRFWAAWSAVVLGERHRAIDVLTTFGTGPGPFRERAMQLILMVMEPTDSHALLKTVARDTNNLRWLIQGSGVAGDPVFVPWLINHMEDPKTARLAGEAFSLISGVDLAAANLERGPLEDGQSHPNDDPNDSDVSMDPDDGLPWPDPAKIQAWWNAHRIGFRDGVRHFMGAPVTPERCIHVLKEGYQRQRLAAALYRSLRQPDTPLFNFRAPAWRQQRWLASI
jgi:uncharacterized protein (TIGR02270 family)